MGFIIEFRYDKNSTWYRSGNKIKTVPIVQSHGEYVFNTREAAKREADAQTDGFEYRVVAYTPDLATREEVYNALSKKAYRIIWCLVRQAFHSHLWSGSSLLRNTLTKQSWATPTFCRT